MVSDHPFGSAVLVDPRSALSKTYPAMPYGVGPAYLRNSYGVLELEFVGVSGRRQDVPTPEGHYSALLGP